MREYPVRKILAIVSKLSCSSDESIKTFSSGVMTSLTIVSLYLSAPFLKDGINCEDRKWPAVIVAPLYLHCSRSVRVNFFFLNMDLQ